MEIIDFRVCLTWIFHRIWRRLERLTLTPSFSWVRETRESKNRFNGLLHSAETVETVLDCSDFVNTQLKQGVNEIRLSRRLTTCELSGQSRILNANLKKLTLKNFIWAMHLALVRGQNPSIIAGSLQVGLRDKRELHRLNFIFRNTSTALILGLLFAGCNIHKEKDSGSVSGTIETDEVHVASRYGGRVQSITAQEGDALKPGQPFVQLEASELLARRQFAESVLQELKAGPRREELAAAKQEWEAAAAELEYARAENKRAQELFAKGTVTASERDRAVTRAASLEKSVAAAQSRSELLIAGTRPEKIVQAAAQLAEIETQLKEMQIAAPTNCILEVLKVKTGDVLAPNREVATLLLPQHIWVRVYIAESALGKIRIGEKVRVKVDSFPKTVSDQ